MALRNKFYDLLPPASLPGVQKRDAQHMFLQHKGSHTDPSRLSKFIAEIIRKYFLCICICYEIKIVSEIIFICNAACSELRKEQLRLHLLRESESQNQVRLYLYLCLQRHVKVIQT